MTNRLIETDFPLQKVSEESVREKNIRHGHLSTLHIWWARRPLAASRATALAALLPDPADPDARKKLLTNIERLAAWNAVAGNDRSGDRLLGEMRAAIRAAFDGRPPRVLDPFAGGGAIPLEALRLGCETYALDYNPVAVLLNKAALEFPQRFGSALLDAVRHWGGWVLEQARAALARFYPEDAEGNVPVGYLWARTLPCQNPTCGAEIPLLRQLWLAKKPKRRIALRLIPNPAEKRVDVAIAGQAGEPIDFDPEMGTVARARVRCPVCGSVIDDKTTRRLFREGKAGQRLMAVVCRHPEHDGKTYRPPTPHDLDAYRAAEAALADAREQLALAWGMNPVPDEPLPAVDTLGFRVQRYGMTRWGDLFNPRQQLALITFADAVRRAHAEMRAQGADPEFAKAVATYLALAVDMVAAFCNVLSRWENTSEAIKHLFSRQALPMLWDFAELNPLSGSTGSWSAGWSYYFRALIHFTHIPCVKGGNAPSVRRGSATALPWSDGFFDAVLTDPPYYDNVPYADLSDFFYVWLKRTVGDLYPELFATPLTPKSEEMVADASKAGGMDHAKRRFEAQLTQAFREIHRVLKPEGIAVIVFAHKTTEAWETVIRALLDAGLYMTASWPIHTEMQARLRAQESAALASSIYMVCRKRPHDAPVGEFSVVRREIEARIRHKLAQFWEKGIRGADFFMSAIGPAVEAFGKYARVEKLSGEPVTVAELLEYARKVVTDFALSRILEHAALGKVDAETRFYLLWRWAYNHARAPFDEARKLAAGVGVELTALWGAGGFVRKEKDAVVVLAPHERAKDARFEKQTTFTTMVDALHRACVLWERRRQEELAAHLAATFGADDTFWQVAQAVSEVLPSGDREKQVLQGLLYGRKTYMTAQPSQLSFLDKQEG